jgi:hypothetical protein
MKKPMNGFTSRRTAAYSACSANSATVIGQSQSTSVTARPVMAFVVARWMTSDGSTRKPASAVSATNARGSWRTCTMRLVSAMSQMSTVTTSSTWTAGADCASTRASSSRWRRSSEEPAHEDVERLGGAGRIAREHVDEREPRSGKECTLRWQGSSRRMALLKASGSRWVYAPAPMIGRTRFSRARRSAAGDRDLMKAPALAGSRGVVSAGR